MHPTFRASLAAAAAACVLAGASPAALDTRAASDARLQRELDHWRASAADTSGDDEFLRSVREGSAALVRQAQADFDAGRRWAALHRLAVASVNLGGAEYFARVPAGRRDEAGFEAEWARIGTVLGRTETMPPTFAGVTPAAARAEGEAALPQARILREASLEYGRSTEPRFGLFYLGQALAARDFAHACREVGEATPRRAPPLRSIRDELDELQAALLAAYRPPASVERHGEFIGASSALKEARALEAMGYRHGALLRYLVAAARSASLLDSSAAPTPAELARRLDAFAARIDTSATDHSIARIFLEMARGEMAAAPGTSPPLAVAVARQSLPRYFAALEPRATRVAAKPEVDVTLVRWPFT